MLSMLLVAALPPLIFLATRVTADPIAIRSSHISLPIVKRINRNRVINLTQRDQSRVGNLLRSGTASALVETPLNNAAFEYTISIGVGVPTTHCESCQFLPGMVFYTMSPLDDVIIDTGSANTWVGANKSYNPTATSEKYSDTIVSVVSCADSWPSSY
jgi:hypothetical protein